MDFEIISEIRHVETFASGKAIRERLRLKKTYGPALWRKRKGLAYVRLADGSRHLAELHWYEASGIGRKEMKIKRIMEQA